MAQYRLVESIPEIRVIEPVPVVDARDLSIDEYIGRVASSDSCLSACVSTVRAPCEEAFQCPGFAEYVLVQQSGYREVAERAQELQEWPSCSFGSPAQPSARPRVLPQTAVLKCLVKRCGTCALGA